MCNEGLATTQCLICRRVGISAADRTRLTSGQPRSTTTTTLPAGHVLELRYGCMRIPATSGRVHRSVVAGLCPRYRRCRPRPGCRYPNSWPSGDRGSRASRRDWARGTEYRASWTSTPTSRWWWSAWRWATLGHIQRVQRMIWSTGLQRVRSQPDRGSHSSSNGWYRDPAYGVVGTARSR